MAGRRFVIVEYPQPDTPLARFTVEQPGATVDLISEPPHPEGDDVVHPSLVLVKGAEPAAVDALLRRLASVYPVETVDRRPGSGTWLGRVRIRESAYLHNPGARVLRGFQERYGAPWTHIEQGVLHLRARAEDPDHADALVDEMRRYFEAAGVEAQVEARDIPAKDFGAWEELVQRAIGLAP